MKNPFLAFDNFETKPKRNAFDCSRRNFFTGKLGCYYPTLLLEVNSGDSIQIDSSMLFNFFPFIFPVQTPINASVYFFYGRNRIFWDSWKDFSYNNKKKDHPFVLQPSNTNFWKTGSLADYLGVPTTYSSLGVKSQYNLVTVEQLQPGPKPGLPDVWVAGKFFFGNSFTIPIQTSEFFDYNLISLFRETPSTGQNSYWFLSWDFFLTKDNFSDVTLEDLVLNWNSVLGTGDSDSARFFIFDELGNPLVVSKISYSDYSKIIFDSNDWYTYPGGSNAKTYLFDLWSTHPELRFRLALALTSSQVEALYPDNYADPSKELVSGMPAYSVTVVNSLAEDVDLSTLSANPFSGTQNNPPAIPLNAIPFRFYEGVYNTYFRNEKNDPFIVNGEIEYNKICTTTADGADTTNYELKFRNWAADFLTTAQQSPQQGLAPLVGITVRGDMEFLNEDGTKSVIRPQIADDGTTITGFEGVIENGTPEALRSFMDMVTQGISINDIRNVNAYQRWLENNLRRGLKYGDQVLANTGVKIKYDELDLPEFIGGYTRPVQISSITQSTPSTAADNALGDRAGQAGLFGGSKHTISHFCDEAGYIMCIVCLHPEPVYTQLLPKYFLKSDPLSYYHPQFGKIGMQPISYREVCPIQVYQESGDLNATFGYQRPWYDLISAVDEAHGNMRTNMKDFLMHRTFAGIPQLGADFLHIDPEQLNDVFAYTDGTEDVFQGQMYFNIFVKRAIPRFGIPSIE